MAEDRAEADAGRVGRFSPPGFDDWLMQVSGLALRPWRGTREEQMKLLLQRPEVRYDLVFVDVEAKGEAPCVGYMTEFGAVHYPTRISFHGHNDGKATFELLVEWLKRVCHKERLVFVSDNPAYDWQWINDGFARHSMVNPFGWSARRIGDFYAGLVGDFNEASRWKHLRVTKHDHDPVNDAMGNLEAFERLMWGER